MRKSNPEERLQQWLKFRSQLDALPLDEALNQVIEFWRSVPFVPYYLDPAKPEEWPDPWTLIYENYYCDVAKALGILYTIYLTQHKDTLEPELRIYRDKTTGYEYNLVWLQSGKYVINLVDDAVVNSRQLDKSLQLKYKYNNQELKLEQY